MVVVEVVEVEVVVGVDDIVGGSVYVGIVLVVVVYGCGVLVHAGVVEVGSELPEEPSTCTISTPHSAPSPCSSPCRASRRSRSAHSATATTHSRSGGTSNRTRRSPGSPTLAS